jgi:electron transfer flavoprotein alpha/beta subunit
MRESPAARIDEAVREMERTIYRAVEGALCLFEQRTGRQPSVIEVIMSPYGAPEARKYELDIVRCHMPPA